MSKRKTLSESHQRRLRAEVRKSAAEMSPDQREWWAAFVNMGPLCSPRDRVIGRAWLAEAKGSGS
jgi:hypothetical protein